MMKRTDLPHIIELYRSRFKEDQATKMAVYLKNKFVLLGIQAPERLEINKTIKEQYGKVEFEEIEAIAMELWKLPEREFQYLAINLIDQVKTQLNPSHLDFIINLIKEKSWWDTIDGLVVNFVGQILKVYPDLIDEYVQDWVDSNNIWLNRTAILFQLKYKNDTDFELLKSISDQLKHKNEFFVKKAIGWALREYSKTNPREVETYIATANLQALSEKEGLKVINKKK
jgi:3-methyladenine DNA glycosylase AlkD